MYVYVGGQGTAQNTAGGFNGGGSTKNYGGSGGGATDVRKTNGAWNLAEGLNSRIIVAGRRPEEQDITL